MSTPPPLSEDDREELIAYLDGELDEERARAVETRINLDPTVRAEAETLRKTWDLLDYLPRPEPSPSFTNRTLVRLSTRETGDALRPVSAGRRRLLALGWAAAAMLAGVAAYAAAVALVPPRPGEDDLLRELRIIENLRYYEPVETPEFLRELDHPDLFGEEPADS
jgi:anti-sigma factor RsiW